MYLLSQNKIVIIFIAISFISINSKGQQVNREYITPAAAIGSLSIERISANSFLMLPLNFDSQYNKIGFETMIVSDSGILQTNHSFSDTSSSYYVGWSNSLNKLNTGGFIFGGSYSKDTVKMGYLAKLNSVGDTVWLKRYGTPSTSNNVLRQARQTSDGGIIAVGSHAFRGQRSDGWLIKTDSAGNVLWDRKYSVSIGTLEELVSVQETSDGGFILGGIEQEFPNNPNTRNNDPILIKVDSMGNQQWRYRYDTPYDDEMAYCIQTFDGNYVCSGSYNYSIPPGLILGRAMLFKVSSSGQFMWKKEYGPIKNRNAFYVVKELADRSLIAVGKRFESSTLMVGTMVRARPNGDSIFVRSYEYDPGETSNENRLHDVLQMDDGGFLACGEVIHRGPLFNTQNPWLVRTDSSGCYIYSNNCTVSLSESKATKEMVKVYPNPSKGKVFFSNQELIGSAEIFDLNGRKINSIYQNGEIILPDSKGVFLVRITLINEDILTQKVIRE